MKVTNAMLLLVVGLSLGSPTVQAKDACETVLCMFGKYKGEDPSECDPAVRDYFSIIEYKKHGKIDWSGTSNARQEFLDSCPQADSGATKKINDMFGKAGG